MPLLRNCAYLHDKTPIRFHHDPSLSIPKEVMTSDVLGGTARQGISQGSPLSPDLERVLLGPVLRQVASPDRVVRYGDDGAIGARSHREAEKLIIALNDELERHPLGPFRLKHAYIGWIDRGFEFLKYRYRRCWEGGVWRRPAYGSYERFKARVGLRLSTHSAPELVRYTDNWTRSFARWKPNSLSQTCLMVAADQALKEAGAGPSYRADFTSLFDDHIEKHYES